MSILCTICIGILMQYLKRTSLLLCSTETVHGFHKVFLSFYYLKWVGNQNHRLHLKWIFTKITLCTASWHIPTSLEEYVWTSLAAMEIHSFNQCKPYENHCCAQTKPGTWLANFILWMKLGSSGQPAQGFCTCLSYWLPKLHHFTELHLLHTRPAFLANTKVVVSSSIAKLREEFPSLACICDLSGVLR